MLLFLKGNFWVNWKRNQWFELFFLSSSSSSAIIIANLEFKLRSRITRQPTICNGSRYYITTKVATSTSSTTILLLLLLQVDSASCISILHLLIVERLGNWSDRIKSNQLPIATVAINVVVAVAAAHDAFLMDRLDCIADLPIFVAIFAKLSNNKQAAYERQHLQNRRFSLLHWNFLNPTLLERLFYLIDGRNSSSSISLYRAKLGHLWDLSSALNEHSSLAKSWNCARTRFLLG